MSSTTFDFQRLLPSLPAGPGVYQMVDARGETLYVGKARSLKKRLAAYTRTQGLSVKTRMMLRQVADVRVTMTHTESEALLLENNLIKKLRPRYNTLWRDDKSYPYIVLSTDHDFPRLGLYRGSRRETGRYFGPYPSAGAVRESLSLLQKIFPVRQCEDGFFRNRSRPCLQYQIKRCSAPCVGLITKEDYAEDVRQAVLFLEGKSRTLVEALVRRMEAAAAAKAYERAASYRDRIASLRRVQERQYVSAEAGNVDVIAVCIEQDRACVEVVYVRAGQNLGSRPFFPRLGLDGAAQDVLADFLRQHYLGRPLPEEIVIDRELPGRALLQAEFSRQAGRSVAVRMRVRGERARWLEMARANAAESLRRHLASRATLRERFEALAQALGLEEPPQRLECIDISHTAGEATAGACVVFDTNGPVKSEYRRFNIENIHPGDDYAAIGQVVRRRFGRLTEGGGPLADVVFIDGGKGQLAAAEAALADFHVPGIRFVAVAKGAPRRAGCERLFLSGRRTPTILPPDSAALHLIQQIRDEAHRFAVTGHRRRRAKTRASSPLEQIEGVGEKRRQALLKHLGGLQEVARAGVEDLARVPGISAGLAKRIYDVFHG